MRKRNYKNDQDKDKTFDVSFWRYIGIFTVLIAITLFFPYLFTRYSLVTDLTKENGISNNINIITPFVAIIAAGLTFLAFWVQFKANEQQRVDIKKERFESTFYELLKFHKQNVDEFKIEELSQREVFQELYYELMKIFSLTNDALKELIKESTAEDKLALQSLSIIKKCNLVFLIFYYGQNHLSTINNDQVGLTDNLWNEFRKEIRNKLDDFWGVWKKDSVSLIRETRSATTDHVSPRVLHSYYKPFEGQSKILAHYFRNLYQIVKYVDEQAPTFLSDVEKYDYIKSLRAQLSDYEQVILFYDSLSVLGYDWVNKKENSLLFRYKLVKNAPLNLYGITNPRKIFESFGIPQKEIDSYFEHKDKLLEI